MIVSIDKINHFVVGSCDDLSLEFNWTEQLVCFFEVSFDLGLKLNEEL